MAVGAIGLSPNCFYTSEIREVLLAIEGYKKGREDEFVANQTAVINAIGVFFGGKQFKPTNPFESVEDNSVGETTIEDKNETMDYLQDKFNN